MNDLTAEAQPTDIVTTSEQEHLPLTEHQQTAPVVVQDNGVSPLVQMFATGEYSIEQIEKFIELQERHDANQAKKGYHLAMSKARADMGVALKRSRNSHTGSSYANLDALIEAARPALSANGFNFSFKPDQSTQGEVTEHCHVTHAMGHTEIYSVTMPIEGIVSNNGKQVVNGAQKVGIAMTYAKRYAFSAATGIATEDADGNNVNAPVQVQVINDKQAGAIEDLLISLEDCEPGFRKRWKNHYAASWDESDTPPGLAIPASDYARCLAELNNKLKKFQTAAPEASE